MDNYTNLEICKSIDKLEVKNKFLIANGKICTCADNSNFSGFGIANVILRNDGLAEIHYSYTITNTGSGRSFSWGLSNTALHNLNNNIPIITPISGISGNCIFYTGTTRDTNKNHNAAGTMGIPGFWNPFRIYGTNGEIGQWATNDGWSGYTIIGTAFGTY